MSVSFLLLSSVVALASISLPASERPIWKIGCNWLICGFWNLSGSDAHALTVFNTNGGFLNTIYPYSPLLSTSRATPIATTAFHPHRMLLATGCVGSNWVNIYGIGGGRGGETI